MGALTKKRGRPQGMRAIQLDLQEKLYNYPDNFDDSKSNTMILEGTPFPLVDISECVQCK